MGLDLLIPILLGVAAISGVTFGVSFLPAFPRLSQTAHRWIVGVSGVVCASCILGSAGLYATRPQMEHVTPAQNPKPPPTPPVRAVPNAIPVTKPSSGAQSAKPPTGSVKTTLPRLVDLEGVNYNYSKTGMDGVVVSSAFFPVKNTGSVPLKVALKSASFTVNGEPAMLCPPQIDLYVSVGDRAVFNCTPVSPAGMNLNSDAKTGEIRTVIEYDTIPATGKRTSTRVWTAVCESAWKIDPLTGDIGVQK